MHLPSPLPHMQLPTKRAFCCHVQLCLCLSNTNLSSWLLASSPSAPETGEKGPSLLRLLQSLPTSTPTTSGAACYSGRHLLWLQMASIVTYPR